MADLDLTEAIEAVQASEAVDAAWTDEDYYVMAQAAVKVAASLIAAQVRAQIAEDIEREASSHKPNGAISEALERAARIARGES